MRSSGFRYQISQHWEDCRSIGVIPVPCPDPGGARRALWPRRLLVPMGPSDKPTVTPSLDSSLSVAGNTGDRDQGPQPGVHFLLSSLPLRQLGARSLFPWPLHLLFFTRYYLITLGSGTASRLVLP